MSEAVGLVFGFAKMNKGLAASMTTMENVQYREGVAAIPVTSNWRTRFLRAAEQRVGIDAASDAVALLDVAVEHVAQGELFSRVAAQLRDEIDRLVSAAEPRQHLQAITRSALSIAAFDVPTAGPELSIRNGHGLSHLSIRNREELQSTSELVNRLAAERVHALFQHSQDIVGIVGEGGLVEYVSDSVRSILGYDPLQLEGKSVLAASWVIDESGIAEATRVINSPHGSSSSFLTRAFHADNSWRWMEVDLTNLINDPSVRGVVFNARDVTKYKNAEHQLERMAYFDTLTALPNRVNFRQNLDAAMAEAALNGHQVGVIFLDLDRFKMINDQFGHDAGDNCLVAVGQRIFDALSKGEMVARLGGDEFAVLIRNATTGDAIEVANRVLGALALPFPSHYRFFNLDASAGVAVSSDTLNSPADLLRGADIALYHGKKLLGGGVATLFEAGMSEMAFDRAELERNLQVALDRKEFIPYFQPEIDLATGHPYSLELLMRWQRPDGAIHVPHHFIDVAVEMGIIIPMTLDILEEACQLLVGWNQGRSRKQRLRMSFNVTMREISQPQYAQRVHSILVQTGVDPSLIAMEIDDGVLREPTPEFERFVAAARSLGIGLIVDGYSGGNTSLPHLQRLKPERLKFSRSAAGYQPSAEIDRAILNVVTTVARDLGIPISAVGPAEHQRLDLAARAGCQYAQCDMLAPAMPAEAVADAISRRFDSWRVMLPEMPHE